MEMIAPSGAVYQAGTLSGNPLAMTAGLETLKAIDEDEDFYTDLAESCEYLYTGIKNCLSESNLNYTFNSSGSMFTLFFTDEKVVDFDSAKTSDTKLFAAYFNQMLESGIYLPPSQFEACFVSAAHTKRDFDKTIEAIRSALKTLKK
jgi:glutamate-1-semialdehyde 2,1-aminomutase